MVRPKRPLFVTVLAVLSLFGGIGVLWVIATIAFVRPEELPFSQTLVILSTLFLGFLDLFAAVGMFLGKRWGWWVTVFSFVYALARHLNQFALTIQLGPDAFLDSTQTYGYYLLLGTVRMAVDLLILAYLSGAKVRRYFGTENINPKMALLKIIGLVLLIFVVVSISYAQ